MADVTNMVVSAARSAAMAEKQQDEIRERDRRAQEIAEERRQEEAQAERRREEDIRREAIEQASRGQNVSEVV